VRPNLAAVLAAEFWLLDITASLLEAAAQLRRHHTDPFDRVLIAHAFDGDHPGGREALPRHTPRRACAPVNNCSTSALARWPRGCSVAALTTIAFGGHRRPRRRPTRRPPTTTSPWASASTSSAIPSAAVRPASTTARWRRTISASPTIEVARPDVAAEFPAPVDGQANVAVRLKASKARRQMVIARGAPHTRIPSTPMTTATESQRSATAQRPSPAVGAAADRHPCPAAGCRPGLNTSA
jgi:hypothetical protein